MSLSSWFKHSFYRDSTTATHCCLICQGQPFSLCSMKAAACAVMNLSLHDHVKPTLNQLHCLPVEQRITYKLCLIMNHIHIRQAPEYLLDCVFTFSAASGRYQLRSIGSVVYVLPRTRTRFGEHGFFYSDPAAWNTLPSTFMTLLTPVHSENDSRVYFLIVLTTDYCCMWKLFGIF